MALILSKIFVTYQQLFLDPFVPFLLIDEVAHHFVDIDEMLWREALNSHDESDEGDGWSTFLYVGSLVSDKNDYEFLHR